MNKDDMLEVAKMLRAIGLPYKDIGEFLGTSASTVHAWLTGKCQPRREPTLNPSVDLAYIVGVILGDGSIVVRKKTRNYYIILQVKHKEFAERFLQALQNIGIHAKMYRIRARDRWQVMASSKNLYNFLAEIRATPSKIKDIFKDKEHKIALLRGFFDSEGTVTCRKCVKSGQAIEIKLSLQK